MKKVTITNIAYPICCYFEEDKIWFIHEVDKNRLLGVYWTDDSFNKDLLDLYDIVAFEFFGINVYKDIDTDINSKYLKYIEDAFNNEMLGIV